LLSHYNWIETAEGYRFSTIFDLDYLVYFTDFYLENPATNDDFKSYSIGVTCKQNNSFSISRKDELIKHTVVAIIHHFFTKKSDDAVLYICINSDGNARERKITFGRWFHEAGDSSFEKHDSRRGYAKYGFYSSLIIKKNSKNREAAISSFYHTIDNWFGENSESEV